MASKKLGLWKCKRLGCFEDFIVGPLAWEDPAHASAALLTRHMSYGEERGLLCWDSYSSCLVQVVEWEKEEYWGERVLGVREVAPNRLGIGWQRRQSQLWELGGTWQNIAALRELGTLANEEREAFCAHLKSWFEAENLARELSLRNVPPEIKVGAGRRL